jgi:hypothetical protein
MPDNNYLELTQLHDPQEPRKPRKLFEAHDLAEFNVEEEVLANYAAAKNFLAAIPEGTPANQISQVINTINTILTNLTKLQIEIYSSERLKRLEAALVQAMKKAPKEAQDEFFDQYEILLKKADK